MKLYQLGNDPDYGERALWWLVVSDNLEDEIAGPFPTKERAETELLYLELCEAYNVQS